MCGIGGFLGFSGTTGIRADRLIKMAEVQSHRGPDGQGIELFDADGSQRQVRDSHGPERFGMIHRRLAILDTSDLGLQPMGWPWKADRGTLHIVFNGEIYNYIELREELSKLGYAFHTGTDTEVILAAYSEWGVDCFARFNGMWAIALFDWKQKKLVLSRDRMGIKPLHYTCCQEGLLFSSEIKGLFATGMVKPEVNERMAVDFLKWGLTNHRPETSFEGVYPFPAGHWAEIDFESPHKLNPKPFWPVFDREIEPNGKTLQDNADHLLKLLNRSVERRLRSDVEVGSCLSGGVDSSALVLLASEQSENRLHTFTAASENPALDETKWARLVVEKGSCYSHTVTPNADHFLDDFSSLVRAQEEPFGAASIFAQWCVMKEANRNGIKVLLDGQGADEVFFGYLKFFPTYLKELFKKGKIVSFAVQTFLFLLLGDRRIWKLSEGFKYLPSWLYRSLPSCQEALLPSAARVFEASNSPQRSISGSKAMRKGDILNYSIPALLRFEDRNSMAWSVEGRIPFLDPEIVEFAFEVPLSQMFHRGGSKAVLRKACEGIVPQSILDRRNKLGFEADQATWMKGRLGDAIKTRLASGDTRLEPWYDVAKLRDMASGKREKSVDAELFRLFTFSQWLEEFDLTLPCPAN